MLRNDMFSTRLWILTSIQRAGFEVFFLRQYVVIQNFAAIVLLEYMYIYICILCITKFSDRCIGLLQLVATAVGPFTSFQKHCRDKTKALHHMHP